MINGNKEFKGNLLKSILVQIDDIHAKEELNLLSNLFFGQMEDGKFLALTLQQIHKRTQQVKELLVQKKGDRENVSDHLLSISKLIYLVCAQQCQGALKNQVSPGIIQGWEHWSEISKQLLNLAEIKAYANFPEDQYQSELKLF